MCVCWCKMWGYAAFLYDHHIFVRPSKTKTGSIKTIWDTGVSPGCLATSG